MIAKKGKPELPTGDAVKFGSFVFDPVNLDVPWRSTCDDA